MIKPDPHGLTNQHRSISQIVPCELASLPVQPVPVQSVCLARNVRCQSVWLAQQRSNNGHQSRPPALSQDEPELASTQATNRSPIWTARQITICRLSRLHVLCAITREPLPFCMPGDKQRPSNRLLVGQPASQPAS